MTKWILPLAAVFGFLGVAAGAFGAHALEQRLAPRMLAVFETGARYQMYHALAMLLIGGLALVRPGPGLVGAATSMAVGVVLFSGSLYALALTGVKGLGAITPLGGTAFLVGWCFLAWYGYRAS